jgi:hypothetical protein
VIALEQRAACIDRGQIVDAAAHRPKGSVRAVRRGSTPRDRLARGCRPGSAAPTSGCAIAAATAAGLHASPRRRPVTMVKALGTDASYQTTVSGKTSRKARTICA